MSKNKTRLFSDIKKNEIRLIRLGLLCYKANEARRLAEYYESGLSNPEEINSFSESERLTDFNWPNELYWELWEAEVEREMNRKYFIYARSATQTQNKFNSVQGQIVFLNKYAKREKLNVVGTFSDIGSGISGDRPGLTKMILSLKNGEANGVLCTDWSRLTRDVKRLWEIKKMFQDHDVKLQIAK